MISKDAFRHFIKRACLVLVLCFLTVGAEERVINPPPPQLPASIEEPKAGTNPIKNVLEALLAGYRSGLSRLDGPSCGFYPSCSRFSSIAIHTKGPLLGLFLTGDRLLRCHPDGDDPSPRLNDGRRIDAVLDFP